MNRCNQQKRCATILHDRATVEVGQVKERVMLRKTKTPTRNILAGVNQGDRLSVSCLRSSLWLGLLGFDQWHPIQVVVVSLTSRSAWRCRFPAAIINIETTTNPFSMKHLLEVQIAGLSPSVNAYRRWRIHQGEKEERRRAGNLFQAFHRPWMLQYSRAGRHLVRLDAEGCLRSIAGLKVLTIDSAVCHELDPFDKMLYFHRVGNATDGNLITVRNLGDHWHMLFFGSVHRVSGTKPMDSPQHTSSPSPEWSTSTMLLQTVHL